MDYKVAPVSAEWRTPPRVCRCCLSEGCYKDISSEYYWMGEKEIYAEMLKECFDLTISMQDVGSNGCLICEVCITRLRDASNFKKQVVSSEKRFSEHLKTGTSLADTSALQDRPLFGEIKIESIKDEEAVISDDDPPDPNDVDFDDDDYDESDSLPLKFEAQKKEAMTELSFGDEMPILSNSETTIKKVSARGKDSKALKKLKLNKKELTIKPVKAGGSRERAPKEPKVKAKPAKTAKKGEATYGSKRANEDTDNKKLTHARSETSYRSNQKINLDNDERCETKKVEKNNTSPLVKNHKLKLGMVTISDQNKLVNHSDDHVSTISSARKKSKINSVTASKMNPNDRIESIGSDVKFSNIKICISLLLRYSNACLFKWCSKCFRCNFCKADFFDPKQLVSHTREVHSGQEALAGRSDLYCGVKVDIGDLKCRVCDSAVASLLELKTHIEKNHGVTIPEEFVKYIFPYRLGDSNECALCSETFSSFVHLNKHMNAHYSNHVCPVCGKSFSTPSRLAAHELGHGERKFECARCRKAFKTKDCMANHEKTVHLKSFRYACPECKLPCGSRSLYVRHKMEAHNVEQKTVGCKLCPARYKKLAYLNVHVRSFHMRERLFGCSVCGSKFFRKSILRDHLLTHTKEKTFSCHVCSKCYARKKTLREHLRIHDGDRRFKCPACGAAFVQKCSLKGHVKTHHPGVVLQ